jgi:protein TonB
MRTWTVLLSVVVHGAMFGLVAWRGRVPTVHRGTEVSVVSKPKKAPEPKDEPKKVEPPPPPPPRAAPKVVAPAAVVAPAPAPAPAPSGPRVATGLTLSNGPSGSGVAVAAGSASGNASNAPRSAEPGQRLAPQPPPPPKKVDDPCDAPDTKPRPLGSLQVEYPDKARADGVEGRIQVKIVVGDDGAVRDVQIVQSIEPSLDATVLAVLRTWKFAPATHCGKPAEGSIAWAQRFELGD